jgi:uncharacterized protein (DUF488 family)
MSPQLFTIGHSTHPLNRFLALLAPHGIEVLADIRRFPGSRKFPHFNQDNLALALQEAGIEYLWIETLGGRRRKKTNGSSNNLGLRNESFRNYADYMLTEEFREGVKQLLAVATEKPTAFMCSESVFWRCHRRLVSDFLLAKGITVQHIMPSGELRPHTLTEGARVEAGELTYPPPEEAADEASLLSE